MNVVGSRRPPGGVALVVPLPLWGLCVPSQCHIPQPYSALPNSCPLEAPGSGR